jgi:hypothetical protein
MTLTGVQLDDSAGAGHACFADSTDVFSVTAVFRLPVWRV